MNAAYRLTYWLADWSTDVLVAGLLYWQTNVLEDWKTDSKIDLVFRRRTNCLTNLL